MLLHDEGMMFFFPFFFLFRTTCQSYVNKITSIFIQDLNDLLL